MAKLKYFLAGFLSAILVGVLVAGLALYSVFGHGLDRIEQIVYQETFFVQGLCRMYRASPETSEIVYWSYAYDRDQLRNRARNLALQAAYNLGHRGQ